MLEIIQSPQGQLVISGTILAVLIAAALYVFGKIRSETAQQEPTASELISKFSDSHSRGELSDSEFRTIKTQLATRLQEELKDTGETG